jgi:hypothetical protein
MAAETEAQRITRLTPVKDVLARIEALVTPVEPREVELDAALSRVLARDISAGPLPPRPVALGDGWAVAASLTSDAVSYAPAALEFAVGVDAGEPLPERADAVASRCRCHARRLRPAPARPGRLATSTSLAIERVLRRWAANNTIRASFTWSCGMLGARQRASSTLRTFGLSRTSLASGIIPILNQDSLAKKSGC